MKLIIKNHFLSLAEGSSVKDEEGKDVCKVKGKWGIFSPTKKKKIIDSEGNLQYVVRNKFWHFVNNRTFIFDDEKNKVACVVNRTWNFKEPFAIESYSDDLQFTGETKIFARINFDVEKNGKKIGHIQREYNMLTDAFSVDVEDENDVYLLVAIVIALDNVNDKARKS